MSTTMTLHELQEQYTIDSEIIRIWQDQESENLLPVQEAAIREHGMLEGHDLLVSAPTSSGKTFLAEIAAIHKIFQRQKVLYLLPLKALAEEKYADFVEKYEEFGLDIVISTGDRTQFDWHIERGDFQLAVMVFEKANRMLVRNKSFIDACGLIIVDEIQMTSDFSRGSSLEMLLTAITHGRNQDLDGFPKPSRSAAPQVIALSAVISNLNKLDEWLGLDVLMSPMRPVELKEGILRKDGLFTYRSFLTQEVGTEEFTPFPPHLTFNLKSAEGRREYQYKRLLHDVSYLLSRGEQVLVFRKWKWLTRDTALRLARDLQLPPALDALDAVQGMEDSVSKEMLIESLRHGIAFHNADLGRDERRAIERYFIREQSNIRVICATSTLAMGINLPVNTVIITDLEKPDPNAAIFQEIPLSSAEYKNMSGRAGRLKRQDEGRSILFADTPAEERILWRNYIEGSFPEMTSLLVEERLLDETLFLLASELCASEQDLIEFLRHSYAGTLYWKENSDLFENMREKVQNAVAYGLEHDLLIHAATDDRLRVTETGRICAYQGVSVETFVTLMQFFELLDPAESDPWELIFLVLHNRELRDFHFRLSQAAYESGEYWRVLREKNPHNWETLTQQSEEFFQDRFEVTKRIKMSLLLLDWMNGVNLQYLEIKYSQFYQDKSYSGVIRALCENAGWMLRLLADIADVRHAEHTTVQRLRTLSKMVLYGVDERGIELAALYVPGLTRKMIMQLADAGYTQEEHVLEAELEELARIIPRDAAFRLQDRLYRKYSRAESRHLVDQRLRLEHLGFDSAVIKQVYDASNLAEFDQALVQLFRTPQLRVILREAVSAAPSSQGKDYLVEGEKGTRFVRILPPNQRDIGDEQCAHLLAAGMKHTPARFVLIGRPDFSESSYTNARQFSTAYSKPLLLLPAYEICERYVQVLEGKGKFGFEKLT